MRTSGAMLMIVLVWASVLAAASVTLAWDPATDNGYTTGYFVAYGTSSTVYDGELNAGMTTQFTVPDLQDGTTYYFAVRAYAGDGSVSGYSNEVFTTTAVPPPPVITSLALASNVASPQQVGYFITWTASASGGTQPYQFQFWSQKVGGSWVLGRDWSTTATWSWAPSIGDYTVRVDARSSGAIAMELSQSVPFSIVKKCNGRNCR